MIAAPGFDAIKAARARIAGNVRCTPVLRSDFLDEQVGAAVRDVQQQIHNQGDIDLRTHGVVRRTKRHVEHRFRNPRSR